MPYYPSEGLQSIEVAEVAEVPWWEALVKWLEANWMWVAGGVAVAGAVGAVVAVQEAARTR